MKKKVEEASDEPTAPFWMTTYGDMVTLLLTFFILMISFANMDERKWSQVAKSLQGALGVLEQYKVEIQVMAENPGGEDDMLIRSQIYEQVEQFRDNMQDKIDDGDITVEEVKNGLLIQLGSKLLFDSGDANLLADAYPILTEIATATKNHATEIVVAGHTDNVPINSEKYPSNWELSSARSLSVVKYLVDEAGMNPKILGAAAYGEYRPLVPNESPEHRKINRRVEFLVTWDTPY